MIRTAIRRGLLAVCSCTLLPLGSAPALALAQEAPTIGYSIAPRATYIRWDDALGLKSDWMWGAAFDFHLGDRVRLSPFFLTRSGMGADPTTLEGTPTPFPGAAPFDFDVRHAGVDFDLDLADGNLAPFLRLGGGVLRVSPEDAERLDRITLSYGGGVRFGLERAALEVSLTNTTFRLSPERLYAPGSATESTEERQNNLALGTRITLPLSDQPTERSTGVLGAAGAFDLFGGQLDLDLPNAPSDQRLVGVHAGASLNELFTLSGFYWKGVTDEFDATEDMQGYGAEARFDLGTGTGITPFLVAGGGRLDFADAPDTASAPDDQTALILGAGLGLRLTDRVDLRVAARDYLMDPTGGLDQASDPSSLTSNWQYTAGVSIQIGGRSARSATRDVSEEWASYMTRETERYRNALRRAGMQEDTADLSNLSDTERMTEMHRRMESLQRMEGVAARGMEEAAPRQTFRSSAGGTPMRTPDGRTFTLPVLEEGTVYIRFGPGGVDLPSEDEQAVTEEDVRRMIRAELGETGRTETPRSRSQPARPVQRPRGEEPPADLSNPTLEQRLDQIERQLAEIVYNLDEGARYVPEPESRGAREAERVEEEYVSVDPSVDVRTGRESADDVSIPSGQTALDRARRFDMWDTRPYGGLNLEADRTQALVGARFDFGPLEPGSSLRFIPEAAVGIGDSDPTLLLMGNVQYTLSRFGGERNISPYLVGGLGFYSPTVLAVNTGVGVAADLFVDSARPMRAFVELDGLNFFDRNRMLFGVSLTR